MHVLLNLFLSVWLLCSAIQAETKPAKGVFETCPACKLSAMPELKRFLVEAVMKREYGDQVEVKYIFGKVPSLLLYDDAGKLTSEVFVDPALNYDGLHKWLQELGFVRQAPDPNGRIPSDLKVHTAAEAAAAATAPVPAGPPAPTPAEPGQGAQQQQRRRHRRRRMGQRHQQQQQQDGASGAAAAGAHRRPPPDGPGNTYL